MAGAFERLKWEAVWVLRRAFESGGLPVVSEEPWCTIPQAKRAIEELLAGQYPMFVVHVEVHWTLTGMNRGIWLRRRRHWRRYARRHNLNPKTGARRG